MEVQKIIDDIYKELEPCEEDDPADQAEAEAEVDIDEWFLETPEKATIKSSSPFTKEFLTIELETKPSTQSNLPDNFLFNIDFIKFLQNNFMPYIFLWAGYVFRGLKTKGKNGETITHLTQGSIEKHFGTTKIANGHKGLYPAEYAEEAIKGVLSSCQVDKSILKKPFKDKSIKLYFYIELKNKAHSK